MFHKTTLRFFNNIDCNNHSINNEGCFNLFQYLKPNKDYKIKTGEIINCYN